MLTSIDYLQILQEEMIPALGCTEPISLAFGAATAISYLKEIPLRVDIACSLNIIKNVKGVVVPNTLGLKGIEAALAIGLIGGDANKGLEVLQSVTKQQISEARKFLERNLIHVKRLNTSEKLHFILEVYSKEHSVSVEVKSEHTHIVCIKLDGNSIFSQYSPSRIEGDLQFDSRKELTIENIVAFCETVQVDELKPIIMPQIVYNNAICVEGLRNEWGAAVGKQMQLTPACTIASTAKAKAAAGSDARMGGCEMPVIINSGSGNQGITVSIPVIEFANSNNLQEDKLIRALALSNLVAIRQKVGIGRLSAFCGVVGAAAGSGAGITWLAGGTLKQIEETISNTLAIQSGMICDGAKASCSAKVAVAVEAAFIGHLLAMNEKSFSSGEGIVKKTIEETIDGVGILVNEGMKNADEVLVDLMMDESSKSVVQA